MWSCIYLVHWGIEPRFKVAREFQVAVDAFECAKLQNCSNYLTMYFHIINIKKMGEKIIKKQKHLYKDIYFQHPHTRNTHLFLCRSSFLQLSNLQVFQTRGQISQIFIIKKCYPSQQKFFTCNILPYIPNPVYFSWFQLDLS